MPAFFHNALNFVADDDPVIHVLPGNQHNFYGGDEGRHSPPLPNARHARRPRGQNVNRPPNMAYGAHFFAHAEHVNLSNAHFNIVGGSIYDYRHPSPSKDEPKQLPRAVEPVIEDVDMGETDRDPKPSATSVSGQSPAFICAYVVFRLDQDATIKSLEGNPQAIMAVRNMPVKNFVGYVESNEFDTESDTTYKIHVLRRTIPPDSRAEHLTSKMCIPVLSSTKVNPESSREPLRPDRELPWDDCIHLSSDNLVVRILPEEVEDSNPNTVKTSLPESDVIRHSNYVCADEHQRMQVLRRRKREAKDAEKEFHDLLSGIQTNVTLNDAAFQQAELKVARTTASSTAIKRSLAALKAQQIPIMTVRVSYDLSLVKDLPDPQELLDQQIYLANILDQSKTSL